MSIRGDITVDWSASPRIIEVAAPSVALTVQDLYDTLRSLGAAAIDEPEIVDGSGKEVLSATELVGLTVKLLNTKVRFEDRSEPTDCDISGGNLVALDVNGDPMNPIRYAPYVTVSYAKSSSGVMTQIRTIEDMKTTVEELQIQGGETQYQIAGVNEEFLLLKDKSGASYHRETDSLEAIRDRGDEAWSKGTVSKKAIKV